MSTTLKQKKRITRRVKSRQEMTPDLSRTDVDTSIMMSPYEPSGADTSQRTACCFYCRELLIADQPGGLNCRHIDNVPYGMCAAARKVREA